VQALHAVVEKRGSPSPAKLFTGVEDSPWRHGVTWVELWSPQSEVRSLLHHSPRPTHHIALVSLGFGRWGIGDAARRDHSRRLGEHHRGLTSGGRRMVCDFWIEKMRSRLDHRRPLLGIQSWSLIDDPRAWVRSRRGALRSVDLQSDSYF
jgi:hypothetical protein